MKVVIAVASSSGQMSGVQRHAISLANCLLLRPEVTEISLLVAPWQEGFVSSMIRSKDIRLRVRVAPIGNSAWSRNRWYFFDLPNVGNELRADIVHLAFPMPVRSGAFGCPVVMTLHDLYPYDTPANFGLLKVLFNRVALHQCLRNVDAITCVSQTTFTRLKKVAPRIAEKRTEVVYNSVEPYAGNLEEFSSQGKIEYPFVLCVAQHRRNKNLILALRIFERMLRLGLIDSACRLIVVGIPGPETPAIKEFVRSCGLTDRVILLRGISEPQLQWFYKKCLLLLAPSVVEGFGLPVAEALIAGCRVVCSDIPAFREIGEGHCEFVCLGDSEVERFSVTVSSALHSVRPQPVSLPQLSSSVAAEQYLKLYASLLAQSRANSFSSAARYIEPFIISPEKKQKIS